MALRSALRTVRLLGCDNTPAAQNLRRTGAALAGQSSATVRELMRCLGHTQPGVAMIYQAADDEPTTAATG